MGRDYTGGAGFPHNETTMDQIDLLPALAQIGVGVAEFASPPR